MIPIIGKKSRIRARVCRRKNEYERTQSESAGFRVHLSSRRAFRPRVFVDFYTAYSRCEGTRCDERPHRFYEF